MIEGLGKTPAVEAHLRLMERLHKRICAPRQAPSIVRGPKPNPVIVYGKRYESFSAAWKGLKLSAKILRRLMREGVATYDMDGR